jgi:hypothetical protein
MSDYRQIFLTVNAETGRFINDERSELGSDQFPRIARNETVIFCYHFVRSDGSDFPFDETESFTQAIDNNYTHTNPSDLMCKSINDKFNIAGDWDDINLLEGKICSRTNTNTQNFEDRVEGSEEITAYIEIRKFNSGIPSRILKHGVICENIVDDDSDEPDPLDETYRPASSQDSIDNTKQNKDSDAVEGNLAVFDADGNTEDSGHAPSDYQAVSEKGAANGYAGLDASGKVPSAQLPDFSETKELTELETKYSWILGSKDDIASALISFYITDGTDVNSFRTEIFQVGSDVLPGPFQVYSTIPFNAASFNTELNAGESGWDYQKLGWDWYCEIIDDNIVVSLQANTIALTATLGVLYTMKGAESE